MISGKKSHRRNNYTGKKNNNMGKKKNYETVQPFKNLVPEILLTSGILMHHINVCKIIDLNSIISHTVIRLLHGLG